MSVKETEAIVIKSYNLSEADRIVVFFTRDFGLMRGVAKGAKRLQSKFGSSLEPYSTVRVAFFQKEERELVTLQSADLVGSRFHIASRPAFLELYAYIGELLTDLTPPHSADDKLYRMLSACLDVTVDEELLSALRLYFELWLLRLSGYLPEWQACHSCGRAIANDEPSRLVSGFHTNCPDCRQGYTIGEISTDERRAFFDVQRLSPADFTASASERLAAIEGVSTVMQRLIALAVGREVSFAAPRG